MAKANDLGGLVLLYSSLGKREGIVATAKRAAAEGKNNNKDQTFYTYFETTPQLFHQILKMTILLFYTCMK